MTAIAGRRRSQRRRAGDAAERMRNRHQQRQARRIRRRSGDRSDHRGTPAKRRGQPRIVPAPTDRASVVAWNEPARRPHAPASLRYPDASAPAADRVANTAATITLDAARCRRRMSNDGRALPTPLRDRATIAFSRRAETNQMARLMTASDRDRQRRSRGNAKAANGGAKATADGQQYCDGGRARRDDERVFGGSDRQA